MNNMPLQIALMQLYSGHQSMLGASEVEITAEDLKPEYDLVKAKKSKLSANQRRVVVGEYERLINKEG